MTEQVDVVVVGMGVGGEAVGGALAEAGMNVVGIEGKLLGGECPYWGCIPSKMMIRGADMVTEAHRIDGIAGHADVTPSWNPIALRIREEATTYWDDTIAVDRFTGKGATFVRGYAKLAGPGRVEVDGREFEAATGVVIGTGTSPVVPPIEGLKGTPYWTNREAIETERVPESLIVLGGGAVGLELAQVFARFGARVSIIEAADRLIPNEEPESSETARTALEADGIDIHTSLSANQVRHDGNTFTVTLSDGNEVTGQHVLVSVGRRAELDGLGVETVGLNPSSHHIDVDTHMRAAENLWAVGDVTGHGAFTHVATYQADIATRDILGQGGPGADYRALPRVTFTDPEIGAVGLTEQQAIDQGINVSTGLAQVPYTARGWIHKAGNSGIIKLVADTDQGVLVGATSAGPNGGEILGALSVAVHGRVPFDHLRHMIYAYPTFHRGIEDALRDLSP